MRNSLQIDLLAAARCNLFSYSLAAYQTSWMALNEKNREVLEAHIKVIEKEPRKHNFGILKDLAQEVESVQPREDAESVKLDDNDQRLFFGDEFSDNGPTETKGEDDKPSDKVDRVKSKATIAEKLIDYGNDFDEFMGSSSILLPSQLLMDDSLFNNSSESNVDLLDSLVPSQAEQSHDFLSSDSKGTSMQLNKNPSKKANDVSKWFNLFSDLDPLNQQTEQDDASKNLHAA